MVASKPVIVAYLDHTAKWSGGEIALFRTLTALNRARYQPLVVLAEDGVFAQRLRGVGIDVHILPLAQSLREIRKESLGGGIFGKLKAGLAYGQYALQLAQFLRRHHVKLIHCNSLKADIYGAVAGKLAGIPVLWHVRDHIEPGYLPSRVVPLFQKLAQRWPTGVIANSESTLRTLFPVGESKQLRGVVYDGLMESELTALSPEPFDRWRRPRPRIALLGRIVRWKGQHVFLEAARLLTARGIEAEYQVIGAPLFGEAEYEAEIRQLAVPLGERVSFLGFRDDVPALLQQVDILAHCSISPEPFGQVVVEGMAEGVPVVASDGGGVQEIIVEGGCGLRVPMGDAVALADALEGLLKNPRRASELGRAGYARVREKFTAIQSARTVESVYENLVG